MCPRATGSLCQLLLHLSVATMQILRESAASNQDRALLQAFDRDIRHSSLKQRAQRRLCLAVPVLLRSSQHSYLQLHQERLRIRPPTSRETFNWCRHCLRTSFHAALRYVPMTCLTSVCLLHTDVHVLLPKMRNRARSPEEKKAG